MQFASKCAVFQILLDKIHWYFPLKTTAGSIFGSGNILSWRLVLKSFLRPFSPQAIASRAVVSYRLKDVRLVLVNRLGSLARNSLVRLDDGSPYVPRVPGYLKTHIIIERGADSLSNRRRVSNVTDWPYYDGRHLRNADSIGELTSSRSLNGDSEKD